MIEETVFESRNVATKCMVADVDTMEVFRGAVTVNTADAWVDIVDDPLRANEEGNIALQRIRYQSIHAIRGGDVWPHLFHCYGRLPDAR